MGDMPPDDPGVAPPIHDLEVDEDGVATPAGVDTSTETVLAWAESLRCRCYWAVVALVAERDEARAENEQLRAVLAANTGYEDTPCRFDHHGHCQEHMRGDIDGRCSVAAARELLAGAEAPAAGTDGGA